MTCSPTLEMVRAARCPVTSTGCWMVQSVSRKTQLKPPTSARVTETLDISLQLTRNIEQF